MSRHFATLFLCTLVLVSSAFAETQAAWLTVSADDAYASVIHYRLGPNEDISGCSYALFVDHRKSYIRKIPKRGNRIASFTRYDSEIRIISEGLPAVNFPRSEWKTGAYQRFYFRLLLTCTTGYRYSNISTLRVLRKKSEGVGPVSWALSWIKYNIRYDE